MIISGPKFACTPPPRSDRAARPRFSASGIRRVVAVPGEHEHPLLADHGQPVGDPGMHLVRLLVGHEPT